MKCKIHKSPGRTFGRDFGVRITMSVVRQKSIANVAKAAGVSTATVSRVLNNFPHVREETIRRVREAVQALNYSPLRTRRDLSDEDGFGRARPGARGTLR